MRKKALWRSIGAVGVLGVAIQIVPYGHTHINPPVRQEPAWDSSSTRGLAIRACYDCHSNQTVWPWYAQIAPVSWLVQRDVDTGRGRLNFSEWDRPQRGAKAQSIDRRIQRGSMPPWYYVRMHATARISTPEKQALMQGLDSTMTQSPPARMTRPPRSWQDREGRQG